MADKPDELQPDSLADEELGDVTGGFAPTAPQSVLPISGPGSGAPTLLDFT